MENPNYRPTDNVADYERQNTISIKIQQLIADRLSSSSATIWDPYTYQVHAAGKSNLHGVSRASLPNIDDQDETSQLDEKKKEERAILEGLEARYWMDEDGKKRVRSVDERNPLRVKSKEEGEGIVQEIWELKWQQKSKILRQMADWMCKFATKNDLFVGRNESCFFDRLTGYHFITTIHSGRE